MSPSGVTVPLARRSDDAPREPAEGVGRVERNRITGAMPSASTSAWAIEASQIEDQGPWWRTARRTFVVTTQSGPSARQLGWAMRSRVQRRRPIASASPTAAVAARPPAMTMKPSASTSLPIPRPRGLGVRGGEFVRRIRGSRRGDRALKTRLRRLRIASSARTPTYRAVAARPAAAPSMTIESAASHNRPAPTSPASIVRIDQGARKK